MMGYEKSKTQTHNICSWNKNKNSYSFELTSIKRKKPSNTVTGSLFAGGGGWTWWWRSIARSHFFLVFFLEQ
ncbi:MAG: hypothetical protein ACRYE7_02530 [Janthinobacterium lividum]